MSRSLPPVGSITREHRRETRGHTRCSARPGGRQDEARTIADALLEHLRAETDVLEALAPDEGALRREITFVESLRALLD